MIVSLFNEMIEMLLMLWHQQMFIINSTSYKVGKSLESLLDFSWLMHPTTKSQYCELSDISVNSFKELLTPLHFVSTQNEQDLKQLLFE